MNRPWEREGFCFSGLVYWFLRGPPQVLVCFGAHHGLVADTQTKLIGHGLTSRHSYLSFRHAGHATPAPTATATPTTSPTSIPASTPTRLPSPIAIGGIGELVAGPH